MRKEGTKSVPEMKKYRRQETFLLLGTGRREMEQSSKSSSPPRKIKISKTISCPHIYKLCTTCSDRKKRWGNHVRPLCYLTKNREQMEWYTFLLETQRSDLEPHVHRYLEKKEKKKKRENKERKKVAAVMLCTPPPPLVRSSRQLLLVYSPWHASSLLLFSHRLLLLFLPPSPFPTRFLVSVENQAQFRAFLPQCPRGRQMIRNFPVEKEEKEGEKSCFRETRWWFAFFCDRDLLVCIFDFRWESTLISLSIGSLRHHSILDSLSSVADTCWLVNYRLVYEGFITP